MYESKTKIGLVTERRGFADAATRKGIFQPALRGSRTKTTS